MSRHQMRKNEGPDGTTWHARVSLGVRDPATGNYRYRKLSAPTRKALEAKIADAIVRARSEEPDASTITVTGFLDLWMEAIKPRIRAATFRVYRGRIDGFVVPVLGRKQLAKLMPGDVQRLHTAVLAAKRSPATAAAVHAVLRSALSDAVRWGYVQRNVASAVRSPRPTPPQVVTWNVGQVNAVIRASDGDPYACLWRLALTTGMRRGELIGLRWEDVDFENRLLFVRHTLVQGERGKAWQSEVPKTEKGRRSVALTDADIDAIRLHRKQQAQWELAAESWRNDLDLVFTERNGRPISQNKLGPRFKQLIARADVPVIRFHDCRHTHASLLLAAGENPKVVQERLGHANISMTLDLYSHATPSMQHTAAARLKQLLEEAS